MSLGYADKLKRKKNVGGQLGAPEFFDSVDEVEEKMRQIVEWVRQDQSCIPSKGNKSPAQHCHACMGVSMTIECTDHC